MRREETEQWVRSDIHDEAYPAPVTVWEPWFAWYPVTAKDTGPNPKRVWLEMVYRRRTARSWLTDTPEEYEVYDMHRQYRTVAGHLKRRMFK